VFEFRLPAELDVAPSRLVVEVGSEGGWAGAPDLSVYDWAAAEWAAVSEPILGRNILEQVSGLVSADGLVRVQLASTGTRSGCYYVDLGVEGSQ
jgi:hypothetical protein